MNSMEKTEHIKKFFHKAENFSAYIAFGLLAFFPVLEVVARKFFHTGVEGSTEYTHHLVLVVTFLGGMITAREKKHLSVSLNIKLNDTANSLISSVVAIISSAFSFAFAWASLSFSFTAFDMSQKIDFVPIRLITLFMFLGFLVMGVRFGLYPKIKKLRSVTLISGIVLGSILGLGSITNFFMVIIQNPWPFLDKLGAVSMSINSALFLPLIAILLMSAFFEMPIFIILGGIAFMLFTKGLGSPEIIPNESYYMLISHSIPAIPLFTLTGFILSESKAGERLVGLFRALFSWLPGGLAVMAILVSAFFTTFTGASGVTILALGALLSYVLIESKYEKRFSVGLLTSSGSIGLLFPPSLPIIIYGVTAQVSIKEMFKGGIIPGFLMILALVLFTTRYAGRRKIEREPFNLKSSLLAIKVSLWEILLPVVILLFFFGGITTLVESAAISVVYAIIVEVFINRDLRIKDLSNVMLKALPIIGGVLVILALAKGLSYYIVDAEIPMKLTAWVKANIASKYVFLLLLNFALLITGMFMDIFSAILVVVPLIIPLGNIFGIHPVHLGIIFLANMELGYLTPPVGLNLFLSSYRFEEPMTRVYKDVIPFFLIMLISVLLITYLPFLSTILLAN